MTETDLRTWVPARLERWQRARDAEALGELLKWQRDRAFATAHRILAHDADAEDAVQQAFLKILSRTEGFGDEQAFRAAVYRAVVQCALDVARARRARSDREQTMRHEMTAPAPLRDVEDTEARRMLQEEWQMLDPAERTLLVLCFQEGLDVAEAAAVLETPRETVRDRLARTLKSLRQRLERRGLVLSLLLLAALLRGSAAQAAPAGLCAALDAALPGALCAQVPAAGAASVDAGALVAQAGLAPHAPAWMLAAAAMLVLAAGAGVVLWDPDETSTKRAEVVPEAKESAPPAIVKPPPDRIRIESAAKAPPREEAYRMPGLPPHIQAAVEKALPGFVAEKVETEKEDQGLIYELEGRQGERRLEISVSADGRVLEIEEAGEDETELEKKKAKAPREPRPESF